MKLIYDKIGREIKVGSYIAYGHLLSRSAGLRIGKVLDIKMNKDRGQETKEHLAITVRGVDDDWSGRPPELLWCKSTLLYPERIIVLNTLSIPGCYLELFNGVL